MTRRKFVMGAVEVAIGACVVGWALGTAVKTDVFIMAIKEGFFTAILTAIALTVVIFYAFGIRDLYEWAHEKPEDHKNTRDRK